jgi:hypothetical protein
MKKEDYDKYSLTKIEETINYLNEKIVESHLRIRALDTIAENNLKRSEVEKGIKDYVNNLLTYRAGLKVTMYLDSFELKPLIFKEQAEELVNFMFLSSTKEKMKIIKNMCNDALNSQEYDDY